MPETADRGGCRRPARAPQRHSQRGKRGPREKSAHGPRPMAPSTRHSLSEPLFVQKVTITYIICSSKGTARCSGEDGAGEDKTGGCGGQRQA